MTQTALLPIDGEMTIYQAAAQRQAILDALAATSALEIDLSRVTELDTAGVQVLIMAKKTALADGRTLHLVGHSPAVLEVFELLRLSALFGDPLVLTPH